MRHEDIGQALFIRNREKFTSQMKPGSIAVFHSNDIMPTSADGTMPFIQQTDFLYLTGADQEESILLLFPDAPEEKYREILFLRETNEHIAVWEGEKLSKKAATELSGIRNVQWVNQFDSIFGMLMRYAENLYLLTNEHYRQASETETRTDRFISECKRRFPLHRYERSFPILNEIRAVKETREIELIRKACLITKKGFERVLKFVKPGITEYEIEAELIHEFVRNRSRRFAYTPIIASGYNACVLHYIQNEAVCEDGDMLLMDVGAEYAGYASDMTRTIPVNGRFTERQRKVYDAVLRVQRDAMRLLTPALSIKEYHKAVGNLMEKELVGLDLISVSDIKNENPDWPAYKKYFMHGTSHHLGLDVHDYGSMDVKLKPGMVFTVEPGIYIPEENLGIRLENDIVITESGYDDLMGDIPIEAEEIEEIMNS